MSQPKGTGTPGWVATPEKGNVLTLKAADGSELSVAAHGAHTFSWKTADQVEHLFLSPLAQFSGSVSIRGGVPVVFPQFANRGPLPKHGLLRSRSWSLVEAAQPQSGDATARFQIEDNDASRKLWPHPFRAEVAVRVGGASMDVSLAILNTGDAPFEFTTALHSYLQVDDITDVRIAGLKGLTYSDSADGGRMKTESHEQIAIEGEVDRIYFDAPRHIDLIEPHRRLRVESSGFANAVVWNPGAKKARGLTDLDADGWRRFVCIESATIGRAVSLKPGERWTASQKLIAG